MLQSRVRSGAPLHGVAAPSGIVLTIDGCLDQQAGEALVGAVTDAVVQGAGRLEVDLCSITGFTDDGACSLVAIRNLCDGLAHGLHYCTGQGPGREALLAAFAERS